MTHPSKRNGSGFEVPVAVCSLRRSCKKGRKSANIHARSAVVRGIPDNGSLIGDANRSNQPPHVRLRTHRKKGFIKLMIANGEQDWHEH
jgi:hypothetical protein